jgi:TPR repeat protein
LATGEFRQGQKYLDAKFYDKAIAQWTPLANGENKLPIITTVFGLFNYETRAQQKVGSAHMYRDDGNTNVDEAIKYFNLAASGGDEIAQFTLAQEYSNRISADPQGKKRISFYEKDMILADMWVKVAVMQKTKKSRKYDTYIKLYEKEMTADQIAKATSLAEECMENDFQNCGY